MGGVQYRGFGFPLYYADTHEHNSTQTRTHTHMYTYTPPHLPWWCVSTNTRPPPAGPRVRSEVGVPTQGGPCGGQRRVGGKHASSDGQRHQSCPLLPSRHRRVKHQRDPGPCVCVTVSPFAPLATVLAVQVVSPDRFLHLPASFNRHLRLFPSLISIDFTSAFESPSESCISTVFCVTTLLPFELWGFRLVMDPCRHVYNCHAPFRTCILITANPSFFKKFQRGNV